MKVKLEDVCEINMGQSPDSSSYNENSEGLPFYQGNADFGEIHPKTRVWCSLPIKKAKNGDVLISVRAPIGALNIADKDCCIGRGLAALTPKPDKMNIKYLYYALKSKVKELNSKGTGSTFKAISKKTLEETLLPFISLSEQEIIVQKISGLYNLLTLRHQQLEKLDLLVKSRFIEMFGDVDNNSYDFPKVRLGEVAKLQGGYAFKQKDFVDEGVPLVQIGNVNTDYLNWEVINRVPNSYLEKYNDFCLYEGDLVLAMTRPVIKSLNSVKIAKVSNKDLPCLLNQRVGRFIFSNSMNPIFIEILCKTQHFKNYVEKMSGNSLQPNISSRQVEDYVILLPPIGLQNKFADFVQQVDKSKFVIKQSIEKLELLKNKLMQDYFG